MGRTGCGGGGGGGDWSGWGWGGGGGGWVTGVDEGTGHQQQQTKKHTTSSHLPY